MLIVGNELIKLNTVFPLLREKVENQYDYIVYCFGGIETQNVSRRLNLDHDYIVYCFGGIETKLTLS